MPLAQQVGARSYERRESPYGQVHYWSLWEEPKNSSSLTDIGALAEGYVTVSPLRLDVNDPSTLKLLAEWPLTVDEARQRAASIP